MKKFRCIVGCVAVASLMLTACTGKDAADVASQVAEVASEEGMDITKIDIDSYITALGNYSGLTVETEKKMVITDATVDQYIDYVVENSGMTGEKTEVDRPVKTGDVVNIDYVGTKDGVAFDGGTGNYDLTIGSGQFIPGFEDGLIGHEKGEVVTLPLTFPENYGNSDLAGQNVEFEVTINTISEQAPFELTDEYVTGLGIDGVTNAAEFKTYIKNSLESNAETSYENGKRDALLNAIYDASSFSDTEMPEKLLNYYIEQTTAEDRNKAQTYGTTIEEYVSVIYGMSYDDYMAQAKETAIVKLRDVMLCQKIATIEGITITEDEVEKELANNASQYGYESVDAFLNVISKDDFRNYLIELKVIDKLLENTTVIDKEETTSAEE